MACSIIASFEEHDNIKKLQSYFDDFTVADWENPQEIIDNAETILKTINDISGNISGFETPFLLQPIWKTKGKSPSLSPNCLDVFIWSNAGLTRFIQEISMSMIGTHNKKITRQFRTTVWLFKMLYDFSLNSTFDHEDIIDKLSFNVKNDKAFASSGAVTSTYMECANLTQPRITKDEIKKIILGGGQSLLSPERRFDAIIYNSPELFE